MKPSNLLLAGIIIRILNIVYLDTSSIHNLPIIPIKFISIILLLILLLASLQPILEAAPTSENMLLVGAIILGIGGALLSVFNFSFHVVAYRILVAMISIFTILALRDLSNTSARIYLGLLTIVFLDFITLIFPTVSNDVLIDIVGVAFELLLIAGVGHYFMNKSLESEEYLLFAGLGAVSVGVALFILDYDVPLLIIRTLIEQTLGVREFSFAIFGFNITRDIIFVLHFLEISVLTGILIYKRPRNIFLAVLLCGFNMTLPILSGLRAAALLFYLNRNEEGIDRYPVFITNFLNRK